MKPSLESKEIVFVGGGISALTAAYYLEQLAIAAGIKLRITIFEQEPELGGKIKSIRRGRFLIEYGPDSIATRQPAVYQLIEELKMQEQVISPLERRFAIIRNSRLEKVDLSLLAPFPRNAKALLSTSLVSWKGKLRACLGGAASHLTSDRIFTSEGDQDLASYFRKKWGREMLDSLLGPLFSGLYGGDLSKISKRVLQTPPATKNSKPLPPYIGFRDGISTLIKTIAAQLVNTTIYTAEAVSNLEKISEGILVKTAKREIATSACIITTPAHVASKLLLELEPAASAQLQEFKASDAAIVSLGFLNFESIGDILEQAGSGVIIPLSESESIRGITISSRKWINRSADTQLLVRVFGREGVFEALSKEEAIKISLKELFRLLGVTGDLLYSDLHLWKLGSAQCGVGHAEKVSNIKESLRSVPGIFLLGAPYGGVGIGDCIQSAKAMAKEIFDRTAYDERSEAVPQNLQDPYKEILQK